jgi:hypothetical protein
MVETSALKRVCLVIGLLLMLAVPQKMNAQTPSPSTGIEGVIAVGPIHGGPSRAGVEDSAPVANTVFEVTNAAGLVTAFTTDEAGRFRVAAAPGRYSITPRERKAKIGGCGTLEVEVTADGFKKIHWECDSGIR